MAICRFFEQGNCRNGNNCKFEHVSQGMNRGRGGYQGGFQPSKGGYNAFNQGQNQPRGGFANSNGRGNFNQRGAGHNNGTSRAKEAWTVEAKVIEADLKTERPTWPFSCYAPKSDAPRHLIEGKLELSAEEMRLEAYKLVAQGSTTKVLQIESAAAAEMQGIIQQILNNIPGAIRYIAAGLDSHPNRQDMERDGLVHANNQGPIGFGQSSAPKPNPFAQSSTIRSNPFDQPAGGATNPFGQPPAGAANPFGQRAAALANPFGQFSGSTPFGVQKSNPFGKPSSISNNSVDVQVAAKPNPFGNSTPPVQNGGFGQPSALGSQARTNPFGQPSTSPFAKVVPSNTNPFGQQDITSMNSSKVKQPNPFDKSSPFSQGQSQAITAPNPFAQPRNADSCQPNPFGQPIQTSIVRPNPFGGGSKHPRNFEASDPQAGAEVNSFGQPSRPSQPAANPFGGNQPPQSTVPLSQSAPINMGSSGALQSQRVFDKGIPTAPHVENPPLYMYGNDEDTFRSAYEHAKQEGQFQDGLVPMLPPKTDWITYDNM